MAIAYVQDTGSTITTGTTAAATFATNPIVGNTVFGSAGHSPGGSAATSYTFTDSIGGNTWTTDTALDITGDGKHVAAIIGSANVASTGASFKITLTQNGGGASNLSSTYTTYEFSGIATSSPFDSAGSATGTDTAGTTRTSPLNITGGSPAGGNELALMIWTCTETATTLTSLTPNSGFTQNAVNLSAATTKCVAGLSYNVIANVSGAQTFGESVAPTTGVGSSSSKAVSIFNLYKAASAAQPTALPDANNFSQFFNPWPGFMARSQWWGGPVIFPARAAFVPDNWWSPSGARRVIADWAAVPPGVFQGVPHPPSTPPIDLWWARSPAGQRVILGWDSVPFVPTSAAVTVTYVPQSFWDPKAAARASSVDWTLVPFAPSLSILLPESWWAQPRGAQRAAPDWWQFTGVLSSVNFIPQSWWDAKPAARSAVTDWGQVPFLPKSAPFVYQSWWDTRQFIRPSQLAWTAVPVVPSAPPTLPPFISQSWWDARPVARVVAMPFDNINFSQKHILIPNPLYIGNYPGPYYVIGGPNITRKLQ